MVGTAKGTGRPRKALVMSDKGVVAVFGKRDKFTRRFETALGEYPFRIEYHDTPSKVLSAVGRASDVRTREGLEADVTRKLEPTISRRSVVPVLFIINFLSRVQRPAKLGLQRSAWLKDWKGWEKSCLEALHVLNERAPGVPILITADETKQKGVIERALSLGADEFIGVDESKIALVVCKRLDSVFASAEKDWAGYERWARDLGLRHREPQRSAGAFLSSADSVLTEQPPVSQQPVAEEWEDQPSPDEAKAALDRVHKYAAAVPTPSDRRRSVVEAFRIITPQLRAKSGRLDAKLIAARLGVSLRQLASVAEVSHQALSENPDSKAAQAGFTSIARVLQLLDEFLPTDEVSAWLQTSHARLSGSTPLEAMLDGRAERVAAMLESVREGGVG